LCNARFFLFFVFGTAIIKKKTMAGCGQTTKVPTSREIQQELTRFVMKKTFPNPSPETIKMWQKASDIGYTLQINIKSPPKTIDVFVPFGYVWVIAYEDDNFRFLQRVKPSTFASATEYSLKEDYNILTNTDEDDYFQTVCQ